MATKFLIIGMSGIVVLAALAWQGYHGQALRLWPLHLWVFVVLPVSWHHAILRKPPPRLARAREDRDDLWYTSNLRAGLAVFTLPALITLYLLYLALMDSAFTHSRTGHKIMLLTGLMWVVCCGLWVQQSLTRRSPLVAQVQKGTLEQVAIGYSKPRAVVVLVIVAAVGLWLALNVVAGMISGNIVFIITGAIALIGWGLVLAFVGMRALRAVIATAPVVFIDAKGITDIRLTPSFAAWKDIGRISLGYSGSWYKLRVAFRHYDKARPYVGRPYLLRKMFNMVNQLGDWNISVWLLELSRTDILDIATQFQHRARQSRPVQHPQRPPLPDTGP